jgi:hypothetical protein
MPERPVTPSDCAIAVALPLSADELRAQLVAENPSDFVRGVQGRLRGTPVDAVCAAYAAEVADAGRVLAGARALGVTVVPGARLADLTRLTERFRVVSILAHTPSAEITGEDIQDVAALATLARVGRTPDQRRVRRFLRCSGIDLGAGAPLPEVSAVASTLQALVWTPARSAPRRRGMLDRTQLEDAFPGAVRRSPVLELRDGLHTLAAVRRAVAPSFDGVLDLSTCTSAILGEALKRTRDDFIVVATLRATHPKLRLTLYELWLGELALARCPVRFTEVVSVVADALALACLQRDS